MYRLGVVGYKLESLVVPSAFDVTALQRSFACIYNG